MSHLRYKTEVHIICVHQTSCLGHKHPSNDPPKNPTNPTTPRCAKNEKTAVPWLWPATAHGRGVNEVFTCVSCLSKTAMTHKPVMSTAARFFTAVSVGRRDADSKVKVLTQLNRNNSLCLCLDFVHPMQDVALHQCLPLSSVCCFPNPDGSSFSVMSSCHLLLGNQNNSLV